MPPKAVTAERFAELLARAKATASAAKDAADKIALEKMQDEMQKQQPTEVDMSILGITPETLATEQGKDEAVDIIREIASVSSISIERHTETLSAERLRAQEYYGTDELPPGIEKEVAEIETEEATQQHKILGVARDDITLNEKQQAFVDAALKGEDVICVGAAGTGKTTSVRTLTRRMIDQQQVSLLSGGTKWLQAGTPGIAVLSYTRKAVNNIRHAVVDEIKHHTLTIHKILEFAPIYYEIEDPAHPGEFKKTMRFEPKRNSSNPLPPDLTKLIFEESSMVGVDLKLQLNDAMPHKHQEIFIGDIQQLPPTFGLAILGFKMLELPVIELTEVYRQALESPIIELAWKILGGNPHDFSSKIESYKTHSAVLGREVTRIKCPILDALSKTTDAGTVKFQVWQKQLSPDDGLNTAVKQLNVWADAGYYNPQEDIILCPFNIKFGTIEINKGIMQHLGVKRQAVVHEVIAGFNKHYLAVGDRVLYDKEDAFITSIAVNTEYLGKRSQPASKHLDRWGHYREQMTDAEKLTAQSDSEEMDLEAIEKFMALSVDQAEDRVNAASHTVTVQLVYGEDEIDLESASEINNLLGGYALTVHKAQGSEWEKVFFIMHHSYAVMNSRELLYTAVTRAKKFLHVIAETTTFEKGIRSQRIKGNTLAEKAEWFKGKQPEFEKKNCYQKEVGEFKAGIYKGD